jgi:urease accessory protein
VEKIDGTISNLASDISAVGYAASIAPCDAETNAWRAAIDLRFARVNDRTQLVERSHSGPLRLLKPLYPEGDANCHAVIVHPPGGIVAGDELATHVAVESGAHGVVTTPGAQKWYRSASSGARAATALGVADDATLEWLPQESIVFNGAIARQDLTIRLHARSRLFAWEIVCFGRATRRERFEKGRFRQRIVIERNGAALWQEHTALEGDHALFNSPIGFGGHTVTATAWIAIGSDHVDEPRDQKFTEAARGALETYELAGASNPAPGFFVVKALGSDAESVRELLIRVWSRIRFEAFGVHAERPRIWST